MCDESLCTAAISEMYSSGGWQIVKHRHWEVDSVCPRCGKTNHVSVPEGETVILVHCGHCTHGYEYTHVVSEHDVVEDSHD